MAARTLLLAVVLSIAAIANAEEAKIPLNGIHPIPGGLKGATPRQIALTLAKCDRAKMKGHVCLALKVYLKTCRAQHGEATLSCVPKTKHHTKGRATACISSRYILKHPYANPACVLRKHTTPHSKAHHKPPTKHHTKPHTKAHTKPHTTPHPKAHVKPTLRPTVAHSPPPSPSMRTPPPPVPVFGR